MWWVVTVAQNVLPKSVILSCAPYISPPTGIVNFTKKLHPIIEYRYEKLHYLCYGDTSYLTVGGVNEQFTSRDQ